MTIKEEAQEIRDRDKIDPDVYAIFKAESARGSVSASDDVLDRQLRGWARRLRRMDT